MTCALFGKLPAKRDFIAVDMPRELMRQWEVWLQGSLAASQQSMGPGWKETYLTAPLWRFWLGETLAGGPVMGALMPSLDGVGRYFPLAVFAAAAPGERFASPTRDPQGEWYDAAETFLLDTLEADRTYDDILAALRALPMPAAIPAEPGPAAIAPAAEMVGLPDFSGAGDFAALLGGLDAIDLEARRRSCSYWWTIGGESCAPLAFRAGGMPAAHAFAAMLAGLAYPAVADEAAADEPAETGAEP